MALAVERDRTTTTAPPKLHQSALRLLVATTGRASAVLIGLDATSTRLVAAVSCDARQADELARVRAAFVEIAAGADPRDWARIGLVHLDRAAIADRTRDEHIGICCRVVEACRRALRGLVARIEAAIVGRYGPGTGANHGDH